MKQMVAALALGMVLAAPAQAMTVTDFLAKAEVLKKKGLVAMGAPELKQLRTEMEGVTTTYRADLERARAAGRPPHSCPPPKGKARLGPRELMADFQAIPPAQRGMSVKDAFYAMMRKRYPCR